MKRGKFITFEGGEGAGKSTQASRLAGALKTAGVDVVVTREPGGAPGAEEIRTLLLHGDSFHWDPMSEALLHFAARRNHLHTTVLPALDRGEWVVSDRFADSTYAYQGDGRGLDRSVIDRLYRDVVGAFAPDLTIVLDVPTEQGLRRAAARQAGSDRYERMDRPFHERLRQSFLRIAAENPHRCVVFDAQMGIDALAEVIWTTVMTRLGPIGISGSKS